MLLAIDGLGIAPCEQVQFAAVPDNPSAATEAFSAVTSAECVPQRVEAPVAAHRRSVTFHGWRVVAAAFVIAVFGWGVGFYGPPVFLSVVRETRGWPLVLISTAVTVHFLIGAVVGANLPTLYRRLGAAAVTKLGALCLAAGLSGWAVATAPWQLFVAAALSGAGWGAMSAAAINAIVSPWFVRRRPAALAMAYNGGSVGGVIFSPLWPAAIEALGFAVAAAAVGLVMAITAWVLASLLLSRTPQAMGLAPDNDAVEVSTTPIASPTAPLQRALLWRDRKFLTLAVGMALGLFAQIGLTAHLFSLLVPALGAHNAGLAMGLVTAMAIAGRTLLGWTLRPTADRRLVACAGYAAQLAGSLVFIAAAGTDVPLLLVAIVLFGAGFGNATSLPPLIAQTEFAEDDGPRVVALIVGIAQAAYAFAPACFGLLREFTTDPAAIAAGAATLVFATAALVQALAIGAFLAGRR